MSITQDRVNDDIEFPSPPSQIHESDITMNEDDSNSVGELYPRIFPSLSFDAFPWVILFCICWLTFGSYYVYDTPGAIQNQLASWFGGPDHYSKADNLNLYAVYSWPNCILAFFGGIIIDKLGVRAGTLTFSAFIFAGQVIFSFGIQYQLYWVAIMGRFVFGLGGESMTVGQNSYTARWFDGKILAFAFGLVVAFSRIGSSANFLLTPILAHVSVPFAVWAGTVLCLFSFTACLYLGILDWWGQPRVEARMKREGQVKEDISVTHVLKFPKVAWLIFFDCLFFYISVLTFYAVASDIMQKTGNHYNPDTATLFLAIPNFVAIFASPLFGGVVDKMGRSLWFLVLGASMQVIAHVMFLSLSEDWFRPNPIFLMIWIGLGYSIFASSIWPLLPFVIEERYLGTAYGTMTSVQNLGLAVFPTIIGAIQGAPGVANTRLQYIIPIFIFIGCAGASLLLTWFVMGADKVSTGGVLNAVGAVKQRHKEQLNAKVTYENDSFLQ